MPNNLLTQVKQTLQNLQIDVEKNLEAWSKARTPVAFRAMETEIHAVFRRFADETSAKILENMGEDAEFQAQVVAAAQMAFAGLLRNAEARTVEVKLLGL